MKAAEKKKGTRTWIVFVVGGGILILLFVAMPSKGSYHTRATIGELIVASSDCRARVSERLKSASGALPAGGQWGCESRLAGVHPLKKYVQKIETNEFGDVRVTYALRVDQDDTDKVENPIDADVFGKMIILRPSATQDIYAAPIAGEKIEWHCGLQTGQDPDVRRYLPRICQTEVTPQGTFAESSN